LVPPRIGTPLRRHTASPNPVPNTALGGLHPLAGLVQLQGQAVVGFAHTTYPLRFAFYECVRKEKQSFLCFPSHQMQEFPIHLPSFIYSRTSQISGSKSALALEHEACCELDARFLGSAAFAILAVVFVQPTFNILVKDAGD
jgi:hypothetical protein